MKKNITLASLAVFATCLAMAQNKKEKPLPPPPPPPVVEIKQLPPAPPEPPVPTADNLFSNEYTAFLKDHPGVQSINWSENKVIHIRLKTGVEERYDLNEKSDKQRLAEKYGQLPIAPPPPPPLPPVPLKD